jgi:hypothetical protein
MSLSRPSGRIDPAEKFSGLSSFGQPGHHSGKPAWPEGEVSFCNLPQRRGFPSGLEFFPPQRGGFLLTLRLLIPILLAMQSTKYLVALSFRPGQDRRNQRGNAVLNRYGPRFGKCKRRPNREVIAKR